MEDNESETIVSINGKTISDNELRENFSIINQDGEEYFCGKCSYCGIEVIFSYTRKPKIIVKESGKENHIFSIYHDACHDRYLRRTID